jgi:hypothetical protein
MLVLALVILGATGLWASAAGEVRGVLLPGGPAAPARPFWSAVQRDIPWWFADASGPSDAYDVSVIFATKLNSGGTGGDYEMAIISLPSPLGNQGVIGTTSDLRWWPAATPNTAGTFITAPWDFTMSYDWNPAGNSGAGQATATMQLVQGGIVKTASADVTQRVLAFVNGGDPDGAGPYVPYTEPHRQSDLLFRLASNKPSTTYGDMNVAVSNLALSVAGGAPEPIVVRDPAPSSAYTVAGSDDPALRQVGFIFLDDVLGDHTSDFTVTGSLVFGYNRLNNGAPPSGANMMLEVKVGDLDVYADYGDLPAPYATTNADGGAAHVTHANVDVYLGAAVDEEVDGQPDAAAAGDDLAGTADEDGVVFPATLTSGATNDVAISVVDPDGQAYLSLFADFNGDGDFADAGETVLADAAVAAGTVNVPLAVPADAAATVAVRVRLTDDPGQGGAAPTGLADNGEVEDYLVPAAGGPPQTACSVPGTTVTTIIARGMGSDTSGSSNKKVSLSNVSTMTGLYVQYAGKEYGTLPSKVRFSTNLQGLDLLAPTGPAYRNDALHVYSTALNPGSYARVDVTGIWAGTRRTPRAFFIYPTYQQTAEFADGVAFNETSSANFAYWDTAAGWTPQQQLVVPIAPNLTPVSLTVRVALADNENDSRPVWITVEAGGVSQTVKMNKDTSGNMASVLSRTLANVPAGTDAVTVTLFSPGPSLPAFGTGTGGGDSVALLGAVASYPCALP